MTTAYLSDRVPVWPWILVTVWLASAALGFWFFQLRDTRPFESDSVTLFDTQARAASAEAWFQSHLAAGAGHMTATVVHVYKPGCACNRFTEPHLAKIVARYAQAGVRFVVATREQSAANEISTQTVSAVGGLAQYAITDSPDLDWLAIAPAALVFTSAGKLVYFGPYSDAAWCGTSGGLIERILDRLLAGQTPRLQPFYGTGCFCPTRM
jgi:hypothetical protein